MLILEDQTGLNAGLNRGLKIGKFIKRNVKSAKKDISIKNAIKVGKVVVPLATTAMSLFPATAPIGIASKIAKAGKLAKIGKIGKIVNKVKKVAGSKVGKFAMRNIIKPKLKNAVSSKGVQIPNAEPQQIVTSDPVEVMPNTTPTPAQIQTIAEVKGVSAESITTDTPTGEVVPNQAQIETISQVKDIPKQDLQQEALIQKENAKNENLVTTKPNYTLPIVVGVGVLGAVMLLSKNSKK